ncbi:hypothetical protein B5F76_08350 [Desulfovibrio sp. An276]|nr:hypothetical protein B5F76_08350 [Desulfovibrio sp. An276]
MWWDIGLIVAGILFLVITVLGMTIGYVNIIHSERDAEKLLNVWLVLAPIFCVLMFTLLFTAKMAGRLAG